MTFRCAYLLAAAILVSQSIAAADAPVFRGNLQHTGVYDGKGAPALDGLRWSFHTKGSIASSPAVVGAMAYVGSTDGGLYAIDRASGAQKWVFQTKGRIVSSPAAADSIVYFGSYDGNFYAVDAASGALKWTFKTQGERRFAAKNLHGLEPANEMMPDQWDCYLSSPVVFENAVYFGSGDGNIYALDAKLGSLKWKFQTGDVVHASPAISGGTLYIGSWDTVFYALDAASGKERWRFKTGEDLKIHNQHGIQSSAAVVDGTVYFGARDAHVYALNAATGEKKWGLSTKGAWVNGSPAVRDGKVYVGTSDTGLLHEIDAKTGTVLTSLDMKGWPVFSSAAIAGRVLYAGSFAGELRAFDLKDKKLIWSFATEASKANAPALTKADGTANFYAAFTSNFYDDGVAAYLKLMSLGPFLSSPCVVDNIVYVGSMDGNLYALALKPAS